MFKIVLIILYNTGAVQLQYLIYVFYILIFDVDECDSDEETKLNTGE